MTCCRSDGWMDEWPSVVFNVCLFAIGKRVHRLYLLSENNVKLQGVQLDST